MYPCYPAPSDGSGSSSAATHPGYVSGRYYPLGQGTQVSLTVVADTIYLVPIVALATISIASLNLRVATGVSGSTVKGAIWANSNGAPTGVPLISSNTGVSTASSASSVSLPAAITLPAGVYWAGVKFSAAPGVIGLSANPINTLTMAVGGASLTTVIGSVPTSGGLSVADTYANDMPDMTALAFSVLATSTPSLAALIA